MADSGDCSPVAPQTRAKAAGPPAEAIERETVALYDEYASALGRFAKASGASVEFAQDAVQDVFLHYFEARSQGQQISTPKTWLFSRVKTVVEAGIRNREREAATAERHPFATSESCPDAAFQMQETATRLDTTLKTMLSPRELECVRLSAEGFQHDEIAEVLGVSIGNVSARLSRVVRRLRQSLLRGEA